MKDRNAFKLDAVGMEGFYLYELKKDIQKENTNINRT